jgi:hypothetical protein
MGKRRTKRVLKVGFESFLVPASISDQKIAAAMTILRELIPCNFDGGPSKREELRIEYECVVDSGKEDAKKSEDEEEVEGE